MAAATLHAHRGDRVQTASVRVARASKSALVRAPAFKRQTNIAADATTNARKVPIAMAARAAAPLKAANCAATLAWIRSLIPLIAAPAAKRAQPDRSAAVGSVSHLAAQAKLNAPVVRARICKMMLQIAEPAGLRAPADNSANKVRAA